MQDVTYAHATVQAKNKGCLLQKKKVGGEKKEQEREREDRLLLEREKRVERWDKEVGGRWRREQKKKPIRKTVGGQEWKGGDVGEDEWAKR